METAMYPARLYTTAWEVELPDGKRCAVEFRVIPIGSSSTILESWWTQVAFSLREQINATFRNYTGQQLELDFSPDSPARGLRNLWRH